jgi:hypothetical protein
MDFAWFLEQTTIIFLNNIDQLVFLLGVKSFLEGRNWIFKCYLH